MQKELTKNLLALFLFFVSLILLYKDFLLHLDERILYNAGDPVLNLYFLKWGADYVLGNVTGNSIFNLPVAFPFLHSLAFSDNLFGNQIIFLPYYFLTKKPLLSYNLWILTNHFLNFFLMYIYLKYSKFIDVKQNLVVPLIGALVFAFSLPSIDLLGGHLQLLPLYFIPLTLWLLEKAIVISDSKYFILLGLSISFQFYLGIQTGFILLVILMFLSPIYVIYLSTEIKIFFKKIWISAISFLLPTLVLLYPYYETSKLTGHRTYTDALNYIPSIMNLFSTHAGEKAIFIGIPTLIALIYSIYFMWTKKSKVLLSIVILSFIFFLKEFHVFELFFHFVPGFDSIRTPGRFILASIALIVVFLVSTLSEIEKEKIKCIAMIFFVALLVSLFQLKIPSQNYSYQQKNIDTKILNLIKGNPTLILPLYQWKNPDVFYMIDRMKNVDFQFPILDIYSGFNPKFISEIENDYKNKQYTKILKRAERLGFKYVLVEKNKIDKEIFSCLKLTKFQKIYEDSKYLLYKYLLPKFTNKSLNRTIKESKWRFEVVRFKKKKNNVIFEGYIKGDRLSGVVQKKEQIPTIIKYNKKSYNCKLLLDRIKDAFSLYQCISNKQYPELKYMDYALKNPKVKIELMKKYDTNSGLITIKVTNTGNEIWYAGYNGKYGLAISYMIVNKLHNIKTGFDRRFFLPYNIKPGESAVMKIPIEGLQTGKNTIIISMVQDWVAWFHDRGNKPLKFTIYKGK